MVFVTGDCHGEFNKFSTKNFPEQKDMSYDDTVIICGDFGIWNDGKSERYWLDWLNEKSFTTVFCDGNHENFDRLYSDEFQIVDFHGGKAHKIRDHVYHLLRGNVFEFDGKKFFVFGGAQSHDIADGILDEANFDTWREFEETVYRWSKLGRQFRVAHISWWKEELPSDEEMKYGIETLYKHGNKVDYVISHCCPFPISYAMGFRDGDYLTSYLATIADGIEFNRWYFGHYHRNTTIYGKYVCLYEDIERVV